MEERSLLVFFPVVRKGFAEVSLVGYRLQWVWKRIPEESWGIEEGMQVARGAYSGRISCQGLCKLYKLRDWAKGKRHWLSTSGLVGLCMSVCNRHVVETERLMKRDGHWSLSSTTCFGVLQGAFRTLCGTLAWILARAMACCRETPRCHTGYAYSKTGLTQET